MLKSRNSQRSFSCSVLLEAIFFSPLLLVSFTQENDVIPPNPEDYYYDQNEQDNGDFYKDLQAFFSDERNLGELNYPDEEVPENFDSREAWPECPILHEIRSQGQCGSCWAFSTSKMATDRICIANKGKVVHRISSEDILSCCLECQSTLPCMGGGNAGFAVKYWVTHGVVSGSLVKEKISGCKPQTKQSLKGRELGVANCTRTCTNENYNLSYWEDLDFGKSGMALAAPNLKQVQIEIMKNGPMIANMKTSKAFREHFSSKTFQQPGKSVFTTVVDPKDYTGGHSFVVAGWGVDNGIDYWLCANSWGAYWAEKGFFKMQRGINLHDMETNMVVGYAEPERPKSEKIKNKGHKDKDNPNHNHTTVKFGGPATESGGSAASQASGSTRASFCFIGFMTLLYALIYFQ